jgi:hypothetical protein
MGDPMARVFRKTPAHNWASHAADAWRYLSLSWREPIAPEEAKPVRGTNEMIRTSGRITILFLGAFYRDTDEASKRHPRPRLSHARHLFGNSDGERIPKPRPAIGKKSNRIARHDAHGIGLGAR